VLGLCDAMLLAEETRPAAEQWYEPAASLIRPVPNYPLPAGVGTEARGPGVTRSVPVGDRQRSALAWLLTRPCVRRCAGVHGDVFWV
jgi:hypothetical protein